ncbi:MULTISPECIES: type I-MYXAN CRISPR-associated protein Cas6/Cmx6 [Leptospira]|uniref:type I-MYXAN CRISPR-associated protein Cas6/Cmx6 n=1 Tax=Leptospira TaxID=171 RepID=UPI000292A09C|nr:MULTISPECIES: type I-MYXAN CRISPR-associated protein Cas6/Cmx6 [Leptospira]EKO77418.1 CRISPR-associated protein Cas6, subtype MYXAN [Leptospira sp. Fiocruz LV3954]EMI66057.1 CRISPR-associated protein Cas6, subtype MYXAN [Leptospira sp. Fiocruz LV4135]MBW9233917.1 type I-MYXAN CRISPR-associated protein Cas6/Cmx6 [Leptospira santarosai]MDI7164613.1 type I-MYXAN CRISPR-associated protein Cas6/Cmx6 [Leptospira santarosai]MDI7173886.1 type I-MYXAN CRISPR-associated protein Cas6/Cmx6 [Leptospira 
MQYLELKFPVQGTSIPADHGYRLYSALCKQEKLIHETEGLSICGISGIPDNNRTLHLNATSKLRIRASQPLLPNLLKLAGKSMELSQDKIRLGIPTISLLKPHKTLYSRLVTIKGHMEEAGFLESVHERLRKFDIDCEALLFKGNMESNQRIVRKTIRIHDKEVVGFPVLLLNVAPEASILLQTQGLGGRRKMGCGHFVGVRV